jgi:hydrogenase maturation factor HypE
MGDLIMAKKEQILLENIFDAASVIEEAITSSWDSRIRPQPTTKWGKAMKELGARKDTLKLAMAHGGIKDVGKELKNMAKDDLWNAGYTMKKGAKAAGGHVMANKTAYGAGLLGLGAAGAGAYSLHDKLGDAADDAGEHINSLHDKLANMINAHNEA